MIKRLEEHFALVSEISSRIAALRLMAQRPMFADFAKTFTSAHSDYGQVNERMFGAPRIYVNRVDYSTSRSP